MADGGPLSILCHGNKGKARLEEGWREIADGNGNGNGNGHGKRKRDKDAFDRTDVVHGFYTWPAKYTKTSRIIKNTSSATRDHLAIERTYLAWLRLSTALTAISGALLTRFHFSARALSPLESSLARPMGIIFFVLSIVTLGVGTVNFFTAQDAYIRYVAFVEVNKIGSFVAVLTAISIGITTLLLLITQRPDGL